MMAQNAAAVLIYLYNYFKNNRFYHLTLFSEFPVSNGHGIVLTGSAAMPIASNLHL
jgi:hypothetical protein